MTEGDGLDPGVTIPVARPYIGPEEIEAVGQVLRGGWLAQSPVVRRFEEAFALLVGSTAAIAVNSCTSALHLTLVALGIGPGDEVIVPAFTHVSTANAVLMTGAKPVFADIDVATFNVYPALLERKVTEPTRALIPVHLFGLAADMQAIQSLARCSPVFVEDRRRSCGRAVMVSAAAPECHKYPLATPEDAGLQQEFSGDHRPAACAAGCSWRWQ
jgi:dTDP-4-amino-4,6-dideoxygalactose transaminase